jgi:hypothetical protein
MDIFQLTLWLLPVLGPLLYLQRWLHREIQGVFLLITHRADITMALFSILFLPGVLLHELSHFLVARLLGVRTGRLSLIPRPLENGNIQLGYVETERSDLLRDAIIGVAPLLAGSTFVAIAGLYRLHLNIFQIQGSKLDLNFLIETIELIYNSPDFWLWFYLIFTISSTMMPSASDRRAWLPLAILVLILFGIALFIGAGPLLFDNLHAPFNFAIKSLIYVLGISVVVHSILLPRIWIFRRLLERVTGYAIT